MTETTDWPNYLPEWLRPLADDPADYDDGRFVVEGTALGAGYVSLVVGRGWGCVDGDFTPEQLRDIAKVMETEP